MATQDLPSPDRAEWPGLDTSDQRYRLRLFVSGMTPRSTEAIARLKAICEKYLDGRYELEVIDIYQQPAAAKIEQIIAAPTLIKLLPPPLRRLVGDLSDTQRVLRGLNIEERRG